MFKQDISRTIGKVLKRNKYKMIPIDKGCVCFAKRHSDKLAFYIMCTDNRPRNGAVSVEMFFAPVQIPDGRISRLNVGLHMKILSVYEDKLTDEIISAAGEKIIAIEKKIGSLSAVNIKELMHSYFQKRINEVYNQTILIYDTINEDVNLREEVIDLKNNACVNIKKRKSSPTFDLCSELIDKLPYDYFKNVGIDLEIEDIKNDFSEHMRAHCILDA